MINVLGSDYRGVIHIGGDRKTVYDYAVKLSPEKTIGKLSIHDVNFTVPVDTSLNTDLYKSMFGKKL